MSTSRRSTNGCAVCKARRKKCDETRPQCLRCIASGRSCSYRDVEYTGSDRHRVQKTKPIPRNPSEQLPRVSRCVLASHLGNGSLLPSLPSIPGNSNVPASPIPSDSWSNETHPSSNLVVSRGAVGPLYQPRISSQPLSNIDPLISLTLPDCVRLPTDVSQECGTTPITSTPIASGWFDLDKDGDEDEDDDPEGVRTVLCIVPTMDKNVKDNTLPFVLHCYSQWAIARVFEPLKVAHAMREQVIGQFSSEDTRTRVILIANVMDMFAKNLVIDGTRKSILDRLVSDVRKSGADFMASPSSVPELDRQFAMRTLDGMLEIFSLQTTTQSIATCLRSLGHAAPIFRRACPEPLGQPVNLTNILLAPNPNLRHFATIDVIKSVTTGKPTYFKYEVPFSLELCERMSRLQGNLGLRWLHGFPDQFILLFAWINSLCETPGASRNSELIAWIETNLPRIEVATDQSGDPLLRIGRMVVQECWRFAVLIYLYMALCKADAYDFRVVCAQKGFMRLVRSVKPGRNPDAYLFTPVAIAGVVTIEERDRETLRHRILNVRECAEEGTTGNNFMLMLEDIWARTGDEGRAAVWSDLGIAYSRVVGK